MTNVIVVIARTVRTPATPRRTRKLTALIVW
jgi:hypothetical protein